MIETDNNPRKPGAPVMGVIVVLLLGGAALLLWASGKDKNGEGPITEIPAAPSSAAQSSAPGAGGALQVNRPLNPDPWAGVFNPAIFNLQVPDGVRQLSPACWAVKGDHAYMLPAEVNGVWSARFCYPYDEILPREQGAMMQVRWRLKATSKAVREVSITSAQLDRLAQVRPNGDIEVSPADKRRLLGMWEAYFELSDQNAKQAAEAQLVAAVREIDSRMLEIMRKSMADRAAEIRAIFTPEQVQGLIETYAPAPRAQRLFQ